jgi:SET domain-containing protein
MTYRPLPNNLTIKNSKIEGLGLFAIKDIKKDHIFGITHIKDDRFENGYIRTPLGGFFNHSDDPNCEAYIDGEYIKLKAIKDIKEGEEITAFYWLYNLDEK